MAGTPINEIFNVGEIAKQLQFVLAGVADVTKALEDLKKVSGDIKLAKDAASVTRSVEAQNQALIKTATLKAKLAQEEEKLALIMAKTAAAELKIEQATNGKIQSLTEVERLTKLYNQAMDKLNGTLSTEAELLMQAKVANAETSKQLKEQARMVLGLTGAYDLLQAEFKEASMKAKDLGVIFGVTSDQFKIASAKALELNNSLKAIDAGVGNFQRNVGNYASGFRNFNLVLREMPNFAISAQIGIQSLSNNLPMLVDELKAAKDAGMTTKEMFATLSRSIFSIGGAAVFLTALLTAMPTIMKAINAKTEEAEKVNKEYREGLAKEQVQLKTLYATAIDHSKSMDIRLHAVKELRDNYGNYLKNFSDEEILAGKATKAYNELAEAIMKVARARAGEKLLTDNMAKQLQIEAEIAKTRKEIGERIVKGDVIYGIKSDAQRKAIIRLGNSKIADLKMEIRDLQHDAEKIAEDISQNQVKPLKEDKTKHTAVKNPEEQKYYNAKYAAQLTDLERTKLIFQSIREEESNSYTVRLAAAEKFYGTEKAIEEISLKDKLAAIDFKVQQDLKKEKLTETDKVTIRKNVEIEKAKIQNESYTTAVKNEMAYINKLSDISTKYYKEEAAKKKKLEEDKHKFEEESIRLAEDKLKARVLRSEEQMYRSLDMLNRDFLLGKFKNQEDFEEAKRRMIAEYSVNNMQAEIAADEALLASSFLSDDKKQKYLTRIQELKKLMGDLAISFKTKEAKIDMQQLADRLSKVNEMVKNISSSIEALNSIGYDKIKSALDDEKTLIERNSALELKRIQDSTMSKQDQANAVIMLEAKKQAQIEANDQKRRKLEVEHAKFERLNSIAGIVSGTSVAVVNALGSMPFGPWNIALAATVGALGAAQLIKALSAPIPKYKHGTMDHKGGYAIVGDGGRSERVILPGGEHFDTPSTSTVMNLPKGTKVLPDSRAVDRAILEGLVKKPTNKSRDNSKDIAAWQTKEIIKGFAKNKPRVNTKVDINLGRDAWVYENIYR